METQYVVDIKVVYDRNFNAAAAKAKCPNGYVLIDKNLNEGSKGLFPMFLCVKYGNKSDAVTNIIAQIGGWQHAAGMSGAPLISVTHNGITSDYYRDGCDLNADIHQPDKFIFILFTKDKRFMPIKDIKIFFDGETISDEWVGRAYWQNTTEAADFNKGVGGKYIYVAYKYDDDISYFGFVNFDNAVATKFNVQSVNGGNADETYKSFALYAPQAMTFKFNLPSALPLNIKFNICSVLCRNGCYCPLKIDINGTTIQDNYYPDGAQYCGFYDAIFNIPSYIVRSGKNTVKITVKNRGIFIKGFSFIQKGKLTPKKQWQSKLSDNLLISEVNIPGTHDTAAINSIVHTPWACHDASITEQLNSGIRALDIRISVEYARAGLNNFKFFTCHGSIGSTLGFNKFQELGMAFKEIHDFLIANATEFIVVRFQVDSWDISDTSDASKRSAYTELKYLFNSALPLYGNPNSTARFNSMPKVKDARGKVFAFQTIVDSDQYDLGAYFTIPNNEDRTGLVSGDKWGYDYDLYIQDKFQANTDVKWQKVLDCIKESNKPVSRPTTYINFASAVNTGIMGTYVHDYLIDFLGKEKTRNATPKLGWIFWDYENLINLIGIFAGRVKNVTVIDLIVTSNFRYDEFAGDFSVIKF